MSVCGCACAKVSNTSKNPNMALNLIPPQVRLPRNCSDVVEAVQVRSPSPPPLNPTPSQAPSNPEPSQTEEVVSVNLGQAELQPRPYQVGSILLIHILPSFHSL